MDSNRFYRSLGELVPFGIWTCDREGQVTYISETFLENMGLSEKEARQLNWVGHLPPDNVRQVVSVWTKTIGESSVWEYEHVVTGKDGREYTVLSRGLPLVDAAGAITSWVGINLDISRRKDLERQLRQITVELAAANRELEARVIERTAELERANEKLRQEARERGRAMEVAEAATRTKSEFLANMSHEIRTPMTGVIGMTELALLTNLPTEARDYLNLSKQSAQTLLAIINDILDLSKIESGKMELAKGGFNLRQFLDEALKPLTIAAKEKGIRLYSSVDFEAPEEITGDEGRLRQTLTNLVSNAIKFTERGKVTVKVELEQPETCRLGDGLACLRFTVSDTGVGIAEDKLDVIFESFAQVGPSHGGTGLGLAIVKRLVDMMGGTISVRSAPGQGSSFTFTAAFAPGDATQPIKHEAAPEPPPPLKALLAEDNAVNRLLVQTVLERRGHKIVAVEDGEAALQALAREPFDFVLMDMRMPKVNGEEATRRIRSGEIPGAEHVPIIALTASALKGDRERFLAMGLDDYVSKPLDMIELDKVLSRVARGRKETRK